MNARQKKAVYDGLCPYCCLGTLVLLMDCRTRIVQTVCDRCRMVLNPKSKMGVECEAVWNEKYPNVRAMREEQRKQVLENEKALKPLGKFVIFCKGKEEFLCRSLQQTDSKMLGWGKSPSSAIKYDNLKTAKSEAQRIVTNKGYDLVICQLHESNTQIALSEEARVSPGKERCL